MNILITGANGGVGKALVDQFSTSKNLLFLHSNSKIKHEKKPKHHWICGDLTRESDIDTLVEFVHSHGGVDVIIHSASFPVQIAGAIDKMWLDYEKHLQLQVKSLFLLAKQLVPQMIGKKFGRIIAIATEYTFGRPPAKLADYVVAKYALVGLIKSLGVELGKYGITSNCISPGTMETNMTSNLPRKLLEIIANDTPTKRLTNPAEVAQLSEFLCSAAAAQITGENIAVSGGNVME